MLRWSCTVMVWSFLKGGDTMAVHHGPRLSKAAATLAKSSSPASAKKKAGTTLAKHKARCH